MFSKLSVFAVTALVTLAAAIPNTTPPVTTPTSNQCCKSVQTDSSSSAVAAIATLLGLDLSGLNVPIGLSCSPITVIGNDCGGTEVTCDAPDAAWGGLIAINCIPITA